MFIQGDVLAVISFLIGTGISAWALTMAYGLLFPAKSEVAKLAVSSRPWKCIGNGALILLVFGGLGFALLAVPRPGVKLLGWLILMTILAIGALGLAGISLNASERLRRMEPNMSHYAAFSRGAGFLIAGCILPIVGWLGFAPVLLLASIGAGVKATLTRVEEPPFNPTFETA